jgi:hypothetical protein
VQRHSQQGTNSAVQDKLPRVTTNNDDCCAISQDTASTLIYLPRITSNNHRNPIQTRNSNAGLISTRPFNRKTYAKEGKQRCAGIRDASRCCPGLMSRLLPITEANQTTTKDDCCCTHLIKACLGPGQISMSLLARALYTKLRLQT